MAFLPRKSCSNLPKWKKIEDSEFVRSIVEYYQKSGFITAIDDFGSGYAGLGLLADFQTNIIKLDMELIRNINQHKARQAIVRHCVSLFRDLNITPLAEERGDALVTRCRH